jgi:molybdopterin-guanine dinucleotide biosynthesis protein A
VHDEEIAYLNRDGRSFVNVNTPEEFEKIREERSL